MDNLASLMCIKEINKKKTKERDEKVSAVTKYESSFMTCAKLWKFNLNSLGCHHQDSFAHCIDDRYNLAVESMKKQPDGEKNNRLLELDSTFTLQFTAIPQKSTTIFILANSVRVGEWEKKKNSTEVSWSFVFFYQR